MKMIFEKGWYRVKLYFMAGLPFEREQDIQDIIGIIKKVMITAKEVLTGKNLGRFTLSVSINGFCPKPFTPFQWHGQESAAALREKFIRISEGLPKRFIKLNYSDPLRSEIECALSRGDSRVADVVEEAWKTGARFDNWTDIFDYNKWIRAFKKCGLDINFYTTRNIDFSEVLPWDIIDVGISKAFFKLEYEKSKEAGIE
jgi:radical SAM superfamily enzyme YgiQ (UPF0313 family)